MGAPSSALLSEIFLQYIEINHILNILTNNNILGYFRYVDDILIIYDHTTTNINTLLNEFNKIRQNLTYTIELENNQQINFLDIAVFRTNDTFEFTIFRKPTYTDIIIPYNSCHPTEQKFAAIRYFANRLNTYQMKPNEREKEKLNIQNIAHNNGFPLHTVNNLMNKQPPQSINASPQIENNKKWATLTYFDKETYRISKIFKDSNMQITFKTKNNLQYLLHQPTRNKDVYEQSGIYQLNYTDCGRTYTGQTGRSFDKRYEEHLQSYKYNPQNSKLAQHTVESKYRFGKKTDIMTIKFFGKKGKYLDTVEKFYIYQETKKNNQLNDKHSRLQ
jgi:hypothetical protein